MNEEVRCIEVRDEHVRASIFGNAFASEFIRLSRNHWSDSAAETAFETAEATLEAYVEELEKRRGRAS